MAKKHLLSLGSILSTWKDPYPSFHTSFYTSIPVCDPEVAP